MKNVRPILAITIGDPAGIGPEIVLKSLLEKQVYDVCRPLVIADAQILSLRKYGVPLKIRPVINSDQAQFQRGIVDVLHLPFEKSLNIPIGKPSAAGGKLSALCVEKSVQLALKNSVQGLVHAPISKTAWQMAGVPYPAHTEMIADLCGIKKFAMAIAAEPLRTVMVTRHLALKNVSAQLKIKDIAEAIALAESWMRRLQIKNPKIGVCGLNPHAGERGLIGQEEQTIIQPAIVAARKKVNAEVSDPIPADSAFRDHRAGIWDCLVTMYHDQSLIPLKLLHSERLVNITLGLPFARTSPGHGTAFDIAKKLKADARPMLKAIQTAANLARI